MLRRDAWAMRYLPADSDTALINPLLQHIYANGGSIYDGVTATQLQRVGDGWRIIVEDSRKQGYRSLEAQHVVLATNAPAAKRILSNSPDTADDAREMVFPDGLRNVVVRLWFDAAPREGTMGGMFTGDFAPDNFFWLHRLYPDYINWHNEIGGSAIELHFYEDNLLDQPERNLIVLAVSEVVRAFPELRGHFIHGTTRRNSKVHTAFRVPDDKTLHVNSRWDNLYACGDWVGFDSPALWMERATTTGIAAANAVLEKHQLEPYAIQYPNRPEILVLILAVLMRVVRFVTRPIVLLLAQRRKARRQAE